MNLSITASVDVAHYESARPLAGAVLPTELDMLASYFHLHSNL